MGLRLSGRRKIRQQIMLSIACLTVSAGALAGVLIFAPYQSASAESSLAYQGIPSSLAANYPSLGFEATSTNELGDLVQLTGSNRQLASVEVNFSSWACQSGGWNTHDCMTTSGATFSQPVTVNVYKVGLNGAVGERIATKTQTITAPYRPSADTTNCSDGKWYDAATSTCNNGVAFTQSFDLSGLGKTLPNQVIVSVAYNTSHKGYAPTGIEGPADSLNVSLPTAGPAVGVDVDSDSVYWNTTDAGGNPAAGVGVFGRDTGWSPYHLGINVLTSPLDAPTILAPENNTSTNNDAFDNEFSKVTGAVKYEYETTYGAGGYYQDTSDSGNYDLSGASVIRHNNGSPQATYKWHVRAIDAYGNVGAWSDYAYITVDKVAPMATFSQSNSNGNTLTNSNVIVTMVTNEAIQTPLDWNRVDDTHFTRSYADNGTFQLQITDKAGNISAPQSFQVKRIDLNVPTISGVTDGARVNTSVQLTIFDPKYQGYDGFNSVNGLTVNGTPVNTVAGPDKTYSYTVSGQGTYTAIATDKAGNATTVTFTIDTTAPTATVSYSPSAWTKNNVIATIESSEPISTPVGWTKVSDTSYQKEFATNGTEDVTIADIAGNSVQIPVAITWIDRSAPTFTIANGSLFATSSVAVTIGEQQELAMVSVDGVARSFTGTAPTYTVSVSGQGFHTVIATDAAGNSMSISFSIDSVAPVVTIANVVRNLDGTYTVTGTNDDAANVAIRVDGGAPISLAATGGAWTITTGVLDSGNHTIDASSTDVAGNTGSATQFGFTVASSQFFANPQVALEDQAVLGAQDASAVDNKAITTLDQDVKGASDNNNHSSGLAWYWWLIIGALLLLTWWIIAAARRRKRSEN